MFTITLDLITVGMMSLMAFMYFSVWLMKTPHHSVLSFFRRDDIKRSYREIMEYNNTNPEIYSVGKRLKERMKKMDAEEFKWMATAGTMHDRKERFEPSRGTPKMEEILRRTGIRLPKMILSLCSGRGGWDYCMAQHSGVVSILSVTFGKGPSTPGHEEPTSSEFVGKEKVSILKADVRKLPPNIAEDFDMITFDGGEKRNNFDQETSDCYDLLRTGFLPYVRKHHKFIVKVLTPHDPRIIEMCKSIRALTNTGNFMLLEASKNSNQELYFVSTTPRGNLTTQVRELTNDRIKRLIDEAEIHRPREPIVMKHPQRLIDYSRSMAELGEPMPIAPTRHNHWDEIATYNWGIPGTKKTNRVLFIWNLLKPIRNIIPGMGDWQTTNTTWGGFEKIWRSKIDVPPKATSIYFERMRRLARVLAAEYISRGHRVRTLTNDEILEQANLKGSAGIQDRNWNNVGDFLKRPDWSELVEVVADSFRQWRPVMGIFNTAGKPEKKKLGNSKGSRMIAYLPIPARIMELKYCGDVLKLFKPAVNKCTVGGLGLHDLGEATFRAFRGTACSMDIAGFDTKVPAEVLDIEREFMVNVGCDPDVVNPLYEVYKNPRILVSVEEQGYVRTKCFQGRGQRMSGCQTTYAGNTLLTILIAATTWATIREMNTDTEKRFMSDLMDGAAEISILSSGDDHFVSGSREDMRLYSKSWYIYNDMGFIRKDLGLTNDTPLAYTMGDIEFCSHYYERVEFMNHKTRERAIRWMPTRSYSEIFGKISIWIGGSSEGLSADAWAAAQAVNLLLNYGHMRDCRRLAYGIRAIIPRNLMYDGTRAIHMPRPWLSSGDILDILNENLFGSGTHYGDINHGFRLEHLNDLGYMPMPSENKANPHFYDRRMAKWRTGFPGSVRELAQHYGGDGKLEGMANRYGPGAVHELN